MTLNGAINGSKLHIIRVGIIGCGEIAQVSHIPVLNFLSSKFAITYLCDVSHQSLDFCASRIPGRAVATTTEAEELCSSPDVDAVIVCNSDAFHVPHAVLALRNNKHVFVEKPLGVTHRDLDAVAEAERQSKGTCFVGYMRRYAAAFVDAVQELRGINQIDHVRVRDIIGPNSVFVDQSGTFPKRFNDFAAGSTEELNKRTDEMLEEAVTGDCGVQMTPTSKRMMRALGGLGIHDLSTMRALIGMPERVIGAYLSPPIWTVIFQYSSFSVVYESGLSAVPDFDAHIEIYSSDKIIRINYDTPYVKGLPTTMTVREKMGEGGFQERTVRTTYEDAYTIEFKKWYECITTGKPPETTIADARQDLEIINMIMKAGFSSTETTDTSTQEKKNSAPELK